MSKARYEIRRGTSDQYHYVLIAPNNEIVGTSPLLKTIPEAEARISIAQKNSQSLEHFQRRTSVVSQPYFNLKDGQKVLLKSEMYSSKDARENGIDAMIKYGQTENVNYQWNTK